MTRPNGIFLEAGGPLCVVADCPFVTPSAVEHGGSASTLNDDGWHRQVVNLEDATRQRLNMCGPCPLPAGAPGSRIGLCVGQIQEGIDHNDHDGHRNRHFAAVVL